MKNNSLSEKLCTVGWLSLFWILFINIFQGHIVSAVVFYRHCVIWHNESRVAFRKNGIQILIDDAHFSIMKLSIKCHCVLFILQIRCLHSTLNLWHETKYLHLFVAIEKLLLLSVEIQRYFVYCWCLFRWLVEICLLNSVDFSETVLSAIYNSSYNFDIHTQFISLLTHTHTCVYIPHEFPNWRCIGLEN